MVLVNIVVLLIILNESQVKVVCHYVLCINTMYYILVNKMLLEYKINAFILIASSR